MFFKMLKVSVLGFLICVLGSGLAFAADGSGFKVGIMNVQKVVTQSTAGMRAKEVFEKKEQELEASLRTDQEEMQKLQEEIEKKSSVWSKEKKDEQILEFNRMRRDLKTKADDARMEMKRLQDKELEPIIKQLEKVVDDFGTNNGYSLILDSKSGVIFYDKAIDISDALVEELNNVLK